MGFMDKVKGAIDQGSARLDGMQIKHKMDAVAKELGYIIYAEQTGRPAPPGETERLVNSMYEFDVAIYEADQEAARAQQAANQPTAQQQNTWSAQGAPPPGAQPVSDQAQAAAAPPPEQTPAAPPPGQAAAAPPPGAPPAGTRGYAPPAPGPTPPTAPSPGAPPSPAPPPSVEGGSSTAGQS